jgi:hypothetical protein
MSDTEIKKAEKRGYSRGYAAAERRADKELSDLGKKTELLEQIASKRQERIYMQCLGLALKHCSNWSIGDKPINNAEGYCRLAKIFTENSISSMDSTI